MTRAPRVTWVGLRGFPNVQGGVESCAEQLCPLLRELGCEVTVITRRGYQPPTPGGAWHGVRFVNLWSPHQKQLEALVHTLLAVLYAGLVSRPDVLHIQAIGPALWTPLARLLGLRVIVTHHGPDYERQKWGRLARWVLRLGEASAARWSSDLIVISQVIQRAVAAQHGRAGVLIRNGITLPARVADTAALQPFGLVPGRYVLLVSRLVPEKRHLDLIAAFAQAQLPAPWRLALVGAADHADAYARRVVDAAAAVPGVVMTGYQGGADLQALYAHAGLFVLPSSHEGLPIALLEALSHGVRALASDIPANLEVGLPSSCHFPLGDVAALAAQLQRHTATAQSDTERSSRQRWATSRYSWARSARDIHALYTEVCGLSRRSSDEADWPAPSLK